GDAEPADFAERSWIVGVEAHEGGQIERGGEAGLAFVEQELEALVGLPGGAESGELPHGPEPRAIHGRMYAARERVLPRIAELGLRIEVGEMLRRVERFDGDAGDGSRRLLA